MYYFHRDNLIIQYTVKRLFISQKPVHNLVYKSTDLKSMASVQGIPYWQPDIHLKSGLWPRLLK